jgi:NAD(P)-dependent dehydrogenase (short-subunit alcohol dehydrogenase family)
MAGKILIYGASGGIGSATARLLAGKGRALHLVGRNSAAITALSDALGASYTLGDVLDDGLIAQASTDAGEYLDGLVYAVGSITLKALPRLTRADFLRDYELNALSAALAVQAALPGLKKSGNGSVVLFSSIAASQGFGMHASIGMAKAAVNGLMLSLAAELAPVIRVNGIAPSLTQTPLSKSLWQNETMAQSIAALHPIPRLGQADDVAALAAFLLSPEAGWITGQAFAVDGGRSSLRVKG